MSNRPRRHSRKATEYVRVYRIKITWPDCGHSIEVDSPTPAGDIRCPEPGCQDSHALTANCPHCDDGVQKDMVITNVID